MFVSTRDLHKFLSESVQISFRTSMAAADDRLTQPDGIFGADEGEESEDDAAGQLTQQTNHELPPVVPVVRFDRVIHAPDGVVYEPHRFEVAYMPQGTVTSIGRFPAEGGATLATDEVREAADLLPVVSRKHAWLVHMASGIFLGSCVGTTGTSLLIPGSQPGVFRDPLLLAGCPDGTSTRMDDGVTMLRSGIRIAFGRDNARPGQMQLYHGLTYEVSFPQGRVGVWTGGRGKKRGGGSGGGGGNGGGG